MTQGQKRRNTGAPKSRARPLDRREIVDYWGLVAGG